MTESELWDQISVLVERYVGGIREELRVRWKKWTIDLSKKEMYEVIGALLARQVTLATQLAGAPAIWNVHLAPIILRSMIDAYITLAWILKDPPERSRKFILYGLGQEKLHIEHRKVQLEAEGYDPEKDPLIKASENWINSQLYTFLTEINVGTWSDTNTRDMAEEAGCKDLYNFAYVPFSSATHNMWQHISRCNLASCPSPLHRNHKIPVDPPAPSDVDFFYRAAKYVEKSFKLFDEQFGIDPRLPSSFEGLADSLNKLNKESNLLVSGEKITVEKGQ